MNVLYCEKPHEFILKNEEIPALNEGEALLKIKRIGICGTDIHAFAGNQPFFTYPRILGHELSGEIIEINGADGQFTIGDHVTVIPYLQCGSCIACRHGKTNCCTDLQVLGVHADGGMQEYFAVPMTHLIKTNQISLDEAALVEPLSIGAHAVRRSNLGAGQTALVIGAGPIGLAVMRFAKLAGANVIAMDINDERLQFCQQWAKVDATVNALQDATEKISELTDGDFPTAVFDATGNKQSMNQAIHYVSHGGTLVFVGLIKDDISFFNPEFHKRELNLLGSRNATTEDFEYVIRSIENKDVDVEAIISRRTTLEQLVTNFEEVTNPKNNIIKAVVELNN